MAFLSNIKTLINFSSSIEEQVNSFSLFSFGNEAIEINTSGLVMKRDQWFGLDALSFNVSDTITVGFKLTSTNPGMAIDTVTDDVSPLKVSVFDIGQGTLDLVNNNINLDNEALIIHEETQEDGNNKLRVILRSPSGLGDYEALTPSYSINEKHAFWIVFDGVGRTFEIFVDGKSVSLDTMGVLPARLEANLGFISVNRVAIDNEFDVLNNVGKINDIIIMNNADNSNASIQKFVNYTANYLADTNFENIQEIDLPVLHNDPSATRITAFYDDKSYLYASRNDGVVMRGSPLVWQTRYDYTNPDESNVLDSFGSGASIESGFLKIINGMVKL